VTDKKSYAVGETAKVPVPSPYTGAVKALFTVERGRVLDYRVVDVESSSQVVEVPIKSDYAPNIYFVAVLMRGADEEASLPPFLVGYAGVSVATERLRVQLAMEPDRTNHYEPRDVANFTITAVDSEGEPVEAELSLALVDKSVLTLAQQGPSLFDHFYGERGLGVQTSATMSLSTEAPEAKTVAEGKGGGGGPGGGVLVRERFPETGFWEPELRTSPEGEAEVAIPLPDNLTTWALQAKALTADTLLAEETVEIVATKDLLLRPVLPRFLVTGDKALLGAVVHNNSEEVLTVEVTFEAEGLEGTFAPQEVVLEPGGKERVAWEVAARARGEASVVISAKAGAYADAVKQSLPVYVLSTPEVVASAGQVDPGETREEAVAVPERYEDAELTVAVEASLAASMIPSLTYLRHYPYECTEQTLSRFLPNVVIAQALQELGVNDATLTAGLGQQVSIALQRLYNSQHYDGGWGWWYRDASDPYMTAYVMLGLAKARNAGYSVDENVMERATAFLEEALRGPQPGTQSTREISDNSRAFIAYVLAEAGWGDLGVSVHLYERRSALNNRAEAYLLMTLARLSPEEDRRLQELVKDLERGAIVTATSAHWEDEREWRTMGTDVVTTSVVIQALSRVAPDSYLLPGGVRWLMSLRRGGRWESTYETAVAVMALTEYMVSSGELDANYSWSVALNGEAVGQGVYTPENLTERQELRIQVARLLADRANLIDLGRGPVAEGETDEGKMYYTLSLRYYPPAEELRPVEAGIVVARQYSKAGEEGLWAGSASVNDMIEVKLTLVALTDLYHVVVEDPFPAGCEGVDTSLRTTTVVGVQPEFTKEDEPWGWWWFSHSEIRDDKAVLFATFLPRGTYEYTYFIRASVPGEYNVRPVSAYQMYFPEVFGHSECTKFTVREED